MFWFILLIFIIAVLSTSALNVMFSGLDYIFSFFGDSNFLAVTTVFNFDAADWFTSDLNLYVYSSWQLAVGLSDSSLMWSMLLDDIFDSDVFDFDFLSFVSDDLFSFDVTYSDFPDYLYIYKSFIFDLSDSSFINMRGVVSFCQDYENLVKIPTTLFSIVFMFVWFFIFCSFYFSYYGKATSNDRLIDHDYLLASTTVEAEEEISSWDDMILAAIALSFIFFWYFGINLLNSAFKSPDFYLTLYVFPFLYYIILLIPAFLAYDFGIYFVAYLRGKGDSTLSVVELMYDYIAFASFYIRLIVQNVRLLLMTFTFASFHELILIHEVNKSFLFGDESYIDAWMLDKISFMGLCFSMVCQISSYIVYFFYELLHLLFVVTAQIIAFHAMVFWLFLFLYTMFTAELHEKFFFQKRVSFKNLNDNYLFFKNSYFVR